MHTLHHRNLHKPLFPTSYQPQDQDPNFPSTPYTLNPPLPPRPPPFFPYNAYNPPPPPSLPTPKPEPKPKPSYPAFPISAIVLICLPSFSIFVHAAIVLYRYLQIYKSRSHESNGSQIELHSVHATHALKTSSQCHHHESLPVFSPEIQPLPPLVHRADVGVQLEEKNLQFYSPATTLRNILTPPRTSGGESEIPKFSSSPPSTSPSIYASPS
ncbi:hypothetical protein FCV25MIE_01673 [Fagus crenata]